MTYTSGHAVGSADKYARYKLWKEQHVPLVYDWLSSRQLSWPHGAVQWGETRNEYDNNSNKNSGVNSNNNNNNNNNNSNNNNNNNNNIIINNNNNNNSNTHSNNNNNNNNDNSNNNNNNNSNNNNNNHNINNMTTNNPTTNNNNNQNRRSDRIANSTSSMRSIFLAERTDNNPGDPNTLLHYEVRVMHELVNKPSDIAKPWIEQSSISDKDSTLSSNKDFQLRKRIIHPGEVNRIRVLTPNLIITQTDNPNLYLWDMQSQSDRRRHETVPNVPTCELTGHTKNSEFAIDVFKGPNHMNVSNLTTPHQHQTNIPDVSIVSGGVDYNVCLWRLRDYQSLGGSLKAGITFQGASSTLYHDLGHSNVVEDVSFRKEDLGGNTVVSVGRDSSMILWDARNPSKPSQKVNNAHVKDINCCDFGGIDGNQIITGGTEGNIHVWDIRRLTLNDQAFPLRRLKGHRKQITALSWNRYEKNVFASGAEDGEILIWKINTDNGSNVELFEQKKQEELSHSSELMFRHVGHSYTDSKITDLDWLPSSSDKWCMISLSEPISGGSRLQIWRMSDLIYRSKTEVMEELQQYNDRVS